MNNNIIRLVKSDNKLEVRDNRPFFIEKVRLLRGYGFSLSVLDLDEGVWYRDIKYKDREAFAAEWEFCDDVKYERKKFDDFICYYSE